MPPAQRFRGGVSGQPCVDFFWQSSDFYFYFGVATCYRKADLTESRVHGGTHKQVVESNLCIYGHWREYAYSHRSFYVGNFKGVTCDSAKHSGAIVKEN